MKISRDFIQQYLDNPPPGGTPGEILNDIIAVCDFAHFYPLGKILVYPDISGLNSYMAE